MGGNRASRNRTGCNMTGMADDFEVYKRNRAPADNRPAVTVMQRGQLSINDVAFEMLGMPEALELLYSRTKRVVGVRPVDRDEPHAYVPRTRSAKYRGHGPYVVSGAAFFRYFGIEVKQTARYTATMRDDALIIELMEHSDAIAFSEDETAGQEGDRLRRTVRRGGGK